MTRTGFPGRDLLEFCRDRKDDVLRFCYYVQAAVTEPCSLFFLGSRSLESFREFGILPVLLGCVGKMWISNPE